VLLTKVFFLATGIKAMEPANHALKPWAKINLSSFEFASLRHFVTEKVAES
jgi:hypothetical protein